MFNKKASSETMKKNYTEWLETIARWASKVEALKLAGIDISYYCYTTGSHFYYSISFSVNDVELKVENDKEVPEEAYLAIEAELARATDIATDKLGALIDRATADIEAYKLAINNLNA